MVGTKDVDKLSKDNLSSNIVKCILRNKYLKLDEQEDNNDIIVHHPEDNDSTVSDKVVIEGLVSKCNTSNEETSSKARNSETIHCEDPININATQFDNENEVVADYVDDDDLSSMNVTFEGLEYKCNIGLNKESKRAKLLRLVKVFTQFHYLMFLLSSLILFSWSYAIFGVMDSSEIFRDLNEKNYKYLIGFTCCTGVALAWAGNQPWIDAIKVYATFLIICGSSIAICPLVMTIIWVLNILSVMSVILFISFFIFTPTILMKMMPIEYFSMVYGLNFLCFGIGMMIVQDIAKIMYNWVLSMRTGTEEIRALNLKEFSYFIAIGGVFIIFSGFCVCVSVVSANKNGNTLRSKNTDNVEEGVHEAIELEERIVNPQ